MLKIEGAFLRSRVAKKLFLILGLGAVLPIVGLGLMTLVSVSGHLEQQAEERLHLASRQAGMAFADRVLEIFQGRFWDRELVVVSYDVTLSHGQRAVLERGDPLILPTRSGELLLGALSESGELEWFELDESFLWWGSLRAPIGGKSRLDVYSPDGTAIEGGGIAPKDLGGDLLTWSLDGEDWIGVRFVLPLQLGGLTLSVSEPKDEVMAPVREFQRSFPFVVGVSLFAALLASLSLVRRTLTPLEHLREGTLRLARRDFEARVEIRSGDEFEEVGESFNQMAESLARQFKALTSINDIGRVVLASFTPEEIVEVALGRFHDVIPSEWVGLVLLSDDDDGIAANYSRQCEGSLAVRTTLRLVTPPKSQLELLCEGAPFHFSSCEGWDWLVPEGAAEITHLLVFPVQGEDSLVAALVVANPGAMEPREQDVELARLYADQVGVAMSNARLVGSLDQFSHGTLLALARTVDMKSPWTSGHSERVAAMGRRIGEQMGLDDAELEVLYRGGLLHDIGKIGIPSAILDKPGRLSDEEMALMQSHPEMGVRILDPISGFSDVLPIVEQHHERYDGLGYPHGIAGEEISLHGRIFAVADVFDALISARPYRKGLKLQTVLDILRKDSGTHFDPKVVDAFLDLVSGLEESDRQGIEARVVANALV